MASGLVPYALSEEEEEEKRPAKRFKGDDFFGPGGSDLSESESDEAEEAGMKAEPRAATGGLPGVDELFAAVSRPEFLQQPLASRPLAMLDAAPSVPAARKGVVGAPVRYSAEQAAKRAQLSALRREEAAAAAAEKEPEDRAPRRPTPAVPLEKAAANPHSSLPRREQERKDREKLKREKGQSSHASWKSEAEMVLRQQFDS